MEWMSVDLRDCSVARALEVVGKQWTLLVLREAFNGVRRFEDYQRHLGLSRSVLSRRLAEMVEDGLLDRVPYREEGSRERHEYEPTSKAWDLYPVMAGLMQWADRHLAEGPGTTVNLVDRRTRVPLVAALVPAGTPTCPPSEVDVEPGELLRTLPPEDA